jgi:hypothetical protein
MAIHPTIPLDSRPARTDSEDRALRVGAAPTAKDAKALSSWIRTHPGERRTWWAVGHGPVVPLSGDRYDGAPVLLVLPFTGHRTLTLHQEAKRYAAVLPGDGYAAARLVAAHGAWERDGLPGGGRPARPLGLAARARLDVLGGAAVGALAAAVVGRLRRPLH